MRFETQAQQACYEKVAAWMKELFDEFVVVRDDIPGFAIPLGSTIAHTVVYPWGQDNAVIVTRAYVVMGAELTPDLLLFLLNANDRMRFGAFGVDEDGDIFFEHSIVGSTVDKEELRASVLAVVTTADHYDDQIVSRWGGKRALDRMR